MKLYSVAALAFTAFILAWCRYIPNSDSMMSGTNLTGTYNTSGSVTGQITNGYMTGTMTWNYSWMFVFDSSSYTAFDKTLTDISSSFSATTTTFENSNLYLSRDMQWLCYIPHSVPQCVKIGERELIEKTDIQSKDFRRVIQTSSPDFYGVNFDKKNNGKIHIVFGQELTAGSPENGLWISRVEVDLNSLKITLIKQEAGPENSIPDAG